MPFNAAPSMGRLTLNILLSFARFKREVMANNRDKVAASKKKGMWMCPSATDAVDRKLIVNEALRDEVTANNRDKRVTVARATVGEDRLDIDLRHDGLVAPASLMTPEREHAA